METIELQLNPQTLARARQLAIRRRCTLEELIEEIVKQFSTAEETVLEVGKEMDDPILGMFADEPELMDEVLEDIMNSREAYQLRVTDG